jgi:hypothetical protein
LKTLFDNLPDPASVGDYFAQRNEVREFLSEPPARPTIQERFETFHAAHPEVYLFFKRFASEMRAAGRQRYGAKSIMERIRWHIALTTKDAQGFKLNNVFTSRYVRLLLAEEPAFLGFFETRKLKAS